MAELQHKPKPARAPRLSSLPAQVAALPFAVNRLAAPATDGAGRDRAATSRLYNLARWKRLRKEICKAAGYRCQQTGAMLHARHPHPLSPVVDHITPHHGDPDLFFDPGNLQCVSKQWHDKEKQRLEKTGRA